MKSNSQLAPTSHPTVSHACCTNQNQQIRNLKKENTDAFCGDKQWTISAIFSFCVFLVLCCADAVVHQEVRAAAGNLTSSDM